MRRKQLLASLALVVVVLCTSRVAANDFWQRVRVLDCNSQPVPGVYVSLYGCTDGWNGGLEGSRTGSNAVAVNSESIGITNSAGYAVYFQSGTNTQIGGIPTEAGSTCTRNGDPTTDVGMKADYCTGSAQSDCSLAVMTKDSNGAYQVDSRYTRTNIFGTSLQNHVQTQFSSDWTGCGSHMFCSKLDATITLTPASCPPTCQPCPTGSNNPTGLTLQPVSGETGYAYMCSKFDGVVGTESTSYPSFISFRSNQKLFASSNSLAIRGNNWGWMAYWPINYLATSPTDCQVNGYIFAGQDSPAGTITASVTKSEVAPVKYTLNYSINLSSTSLDVVNKLQTVHVYFSCNVLTNPAPGQFGNTVEPRPYVSSYTGTATTFACPDGSKFLYVAIHVAIA